jgi:hypothetical protein
MMCAAVGRSAPTVRRLQLQVPYLKRCVGPSTIVILIVSFKTKYLRLVSEIPSFISHSSALVIIYFHFIPTNISGAHLSYYTFSFPLPSYGPTQPHPPASDSTHGRTPSSASPPTVAHLPLSPSHRPLSPAPSDGGRPRRCCGEPSADVDLGRGEATGSRSWRARRRRAPDDVVPSLPFALGSSVAVEEARRVRRCAECSGVVAAVAWRGMRPGPSNFCLSLVLAIELQNWISLTIQLLKPFTIGHLTVLIGGFNFSIYNLIL